MASTALRSLSRAAQPSALPTRFVPVVPLTLAASFSTTTPTPAFVQKQQGGQGGGDGRGRHFIRGKAKKNYKKLKTLVKPKTPEVGARKAFRKRIQLSNDNAIAVEGLGTLEPGSITNPDMAGRVLCLPGEVVDQLRTSEAFRPRQSWELFRTPHFLVREETVKLGKAITEATQNKEALRMIITGDKLTGKSLMLLQAMTHAFVNNWVVIHIPEAHQLTNAHTDYAPVPDTNPMRFTQPSYTYNLLQAIAKANESVLRSLPCARDYTKIPFMSHFPDNPTLHDLAGSVREIEFAWPTFMAFWTELTRVPGRPPVMLTLDGLQHIMKNSEYRDPQFNIVHAHELTMVRLFTDALSGKTAFTNGGVILAASGGNDNLRIPSVDLALSQIEAGAAGEEVPSPDPFERGYDDRVYDVLKDTRVLRLGGVSKPEARALMEYWAKSGMLLEPVTEPVVSTKWTLGGHGILGEMEKASLRRVRF